MDEFANALKQLEEQPELMKEVKNAYQQGVSTEDLAALLTSKGIEIAPAQVEAALASVQKIQVEEISSDADLDFDQLERVAGGGTGMDCEGVEDCDNSFKYCWDSTIKEKGRCYSFNVCDEYFGYVVA